MKRPDLDRLWEAYLRINAPPSVTREWASSPALAKTVMQLVRREVLPLVRTLEREGVVDWFSFLVHGAPAGASDPRSLYIHLRVSLAQVYVDAAEMLQARAASHGWECIRPILPPDCREIAGLDRSWFIDGDIARAWYVIGLQADWLLTLIEQHQHSVTDMQLLNHVVQFKHYFSNMTVTPEMVPDWFESANPPPNAYWIRLRRALRTLAGALLGKRW